MEKKICLRDYRDEIVLDVPQGYFMCWNFTTQAANKVNIELYDELGNTYMKETRCSTNPEPMVSGSGFLKGKKLLLRLDVPQSERVELRKNMWDITDGSAILARSVVILAEDYYDYDFNDIQLSITAFRSKG